MMDAINVKARIEKAIERMAFDYQERGEYMDLDGTIHRDTAGIIKAWEELDALS